jgi:hypothetical protein
VFVGRGQRVARWLGSMHGAVRPPQPLAPHRTSLQECVHPGHAVTQSSPLSAAHQAKCPSRPLDGPTPTTAPPHHHLPPSNPLLLALQVWDVTGTSDTRLLATMGVSYNANPVLGHTDVVVCVLSVAQGVVVSGGRDDRTLVWTRGAGAGGTVAYSLTRSLAAAASGDVTALAVLPSNRQQISNALVAAGCADGKVGACVGKGP